MGVSLGLERSDRRIADLKHGITGVPLGLEHSGRRIAGL